MGIAKQSKKQASEAGKSSGASKPVSFHPLSFEDSLDAILSVKPPPKNDSEKAAKKRTTKKR